MPKTLQILSRFPIKYILVDFPVDTKYQVSGGTICMEMLIIKFSEKKLNYNIFKRLKFEFSLKQNVILIN